VKVLDCGGDIGYTVFDGEQSSDSKPSAPLVQEQELLL